LETFDLIAHPAHPPVGVRRVTARVLSYDANWCVVRWKVEGAAGVVVPAFAGNKRTDGLWQATCFELFVAPFKNGKKLTPGAIMTSTPVRPEPVKGCAPTPAQQALGGGVARLLRPAQDERSGDEECGERDGERALAVTRYSEFNFAPSERWAAYDFTGYRASMTDRAMARAPVITPRRGGDMLFCDVAIPIAHLPPLPWRYALTAVIAEVGGAKSFWAPTHGGERPDFHDLACLAGVLAAPVGA